MRARGDHKDGRLEFVHPGSEVAGARDPQTAASVAEQKPWPLLLVT